ncbi:unnamed protein product [Peniophora sp. CBMAI 1063]|nr:unnamed protein product [Peniophora sp. CBMAI 1063]
MFSKRVVALARGSKPSTQAIAMTRGWQATSVQAKRAAFHTTRLVQADTVKVPDMAESITEGTLKTWSKQIGDTVEADEEIATIETDKIDVSVNAPKAGKIVEFLANEEDTVRVGQDLFRIEYGEFESESKSEEPKPTKDEAEPADQQVDKSTPPPPKPDTAVEKDTAPPVSEGGKDKKDLKETAKRAPEKSKPAPKPAKEESKPAPAPGSRNETRVKMSRMRLRIAERLKESQNTAAFLTTFNEIDMSNIMEFRSKYKDSILKEHEVKLGFMSAFARASALALKEIPAANASIEGDEIVYRDYVDLSVAVATPKGLVTPIIKNVESMSFVDFEKALSAVGKKARDGKLTLEDMTGGSFTISNGGVFGSLFGTPIINMPQAAVLGMHAVKEKPVVVNGQIVVRPVMVVALTYDHRLLDGREAVTFLVRVKEYIEDPRKMLLV